MIPYWYKLIAFCALPFARTYLWWRGRKDPSYRSRVRERFGYAPMDVVQGPIWFHAVSAGETIAVIPLIQRIGEIFPEQRILVTTTTPTGSAEVTQRLGKKVDHCYVPYDFPRTINRFLDAIHPKVLFLVETEIWPVLIDATTTRKIPVYLINARLSNKSAIGYGRFRSLTKRVFGMLQGVACQYPATANRFAELGVPQSRLHVTGNIKFDIETPSEESTTTERATWCGARRVWIAASTHVGEEEIVLRAHRRLRRAYPDLLLILVPRHPNRVEEVETLVDRHQFSYARYSESPQEADVLLVDQMGVLANLYGWAEVAFIGGTLQGTGGHNPIEAAVHGVPMLMGPDRHNFLEISREFEEAECLSLVDGAESIADHITELLQDHGRRSKQGIAAIDVVSSNQGANERLLVLMKDWIGSAISPKDC